MPRKTKKQKIVADYRRRLTELEFRTPTSPRFVREDRPKKIIETRKEVDERSLEQNKKYVVRDLRKTDRKSVV